MPNISKYIVRLFFPLIENNTDAYFWILKQEINIACIRAWLTMWLYLGTFCWKTTMTNALLHLHLLKHEWMRSGRAVGYIVAHLQFVCHSLQPREKLCMVRYSVLSKKSEDGLLLVSSLYFYRLRYWFDWKILVKHCFVGFVHCLGFSSVRKAIMYAWLITVARPSVYKCGFCTLISFYNRFIRIYLPGVSICFSPPSSSSVLFEWWVFHRTCLFCSCSRRVIVYHSL